MTDRHSRHDPPLAAGTKAPDFRLRTTPEQTVSPADFLGQPVVLAFYPADWSPVCSDQMVLYQELKPEFQKYDAQLLGISVDGVWCHLAFAKERNIRFPLLADFEPKGEVSRAYDAYREGDGYSERALFVIDAARLGPLEPRLAGRGQSRAPTASCARSTTWRGGRPHEHDPLGSRADPAGLAGRDHVRGPVDAPLTLLEYGDYECPHCGAAHPVVQAIQARLPDGALRFVFRHFPLTTVASPRPTRGGGGGGGGGPGAVLGDARHAVRQPGAARRPRPRGLRRGDRAGPRPLRGGDRRGTSTPRKVREDFMSGVRSGVNGTPTFYVNGARHDGSWDAASLLGALQRAADERG